MQKEEQMWVEGILQSTNGSKKASPPDTLYAKIHDNLFVIKEVVIKINQWKWIAAAAAIVLTVNISQIYNEVLPVDETETSQTGTSYSNILSSYNYYQ